MESSKKQAGVQIGEQSFPELELFNHIQPEQKGKTAPCISNCPIGTDIRGWISEIAQRQKTGMDLEKAYEEAWLRLAEFNPFPSVMGRICPHPCEDNCNRVEKDGAIAVNALERFIGDWGLARGLSLPRASEETQPESIGVIGSGPAGLSFAYQMARRGYKVAIYERNARPGGMLYYGIPFYRLPEDILQGEIQRILDLGVELRLNTGVGREVTIDELRERHQVLFLGIGAQKARRLGVPGEDGEGVLTGTEYLFQVNCGQEISLGDRVAVVGGGNTAIDAARTARRTGAEVTLFYRRTRAEMPAIEKEIEDALKEGIHFEYLVAPLEVRRNGKRILSLVLQRMELGEPDKSGRRRPVPVQGSDFEVGVDSIIAAISQQPDWANIEALEPGAEERPELLAGGDVLNLGIASTAIGQGRVAAEKVHARLRHLTEENTWVVTPSTFSVKDKFYTPSPRTNRAERPVEEWLTRPMEEIDLGITEEQFLQEVGRCFSCGQCFGCEQCWMYCNAGGFTRLEEVAPGAYFTFTIDNCEQCGKCIEVCPCGFLSPCE